MTLVVMDGVGRKLTAGRHGLVPGRPDATHPTSCSCDACVASRSERVMHEATQASQLQGEASISGSSETNLPFIQWRGPREFVWRRNELAIDGLADELAGLRILHLSDFHTRAYWPAAYDTLLKRIADDPPDLILFTGDFVESRRNHLPAVPYVKRLVASFRARLGCFGTLGNHDLHHFAPQLDGTNVKLLDGQRKLIPLDNASIELIGFPGVARSDLTDEFLRSLPPRGQRTLRIVLSHYPDHIHRAQALQPDLYLSGHTHGGQVCMPGGRPIITHSKLPRRLCRGIHRIGRTWMVVSRGLGFSGPPLRVLCPSEVVELKLKRET